jgi:putative membrane protein
MIRNFSDHAANERTFLAWVRTAIAVMAFGFLVEKFNLFLQFARLSSATSHLPTGGSHLGEIAGLGLMAMGLAIVVLAALRFLKTAREIDEPEQHAGLGARFDLVLAGLLFLLGCALTAYLVSNLLSAR